MSDLSRRSLLRVAPIGRDSSDAEHRAPKAITGIQGGPNHEGKSAMSRREVFNHATAVPFVASATIFSVSDIRADGLVTAPVAPVAAVAVAAGSDPVFAAIEAHRLAWAAQDLVIEQTDGLADHEDRKMTEIERGRYSAASDAEDTAWEALMDQPCDTLDAVRAKATYLLDCPRNKGIAWQDAHVDALLTSIAGGAHV